MGYPNTYDWYQCDEEDYNPFDPPEEAGQVYTLQCICGNRITGTHDDLSAAYERPIAPCGHLWDAYQDVTWADGHAFDANLD